MAQPGTPEQPQGKAAPGSPAALLSSGSGPPGSTCTRSWVRRRTQDPKAAPRPEARRGSSTLSRYSPSSQARGLTPSGSARPTRLSARCLCLGHGPAGSRRAQVPGLVMLCTKGFTRASQNVLPRARAASSSGRKRLAKPCSCCSARFSLQRDRAALGAKGWGTPMAKQSAVVAPCSALCQGTMAPWPHWPPAAREGPLLSPGPAPNGPWGPCSSCQMGAVQCLWPRDPGRASPWGDQHPAPGGWPS